MGTAEFALNLIIELLGGAIQAGVAYNTLPFFQRRKIDRRVEEATAEVIEPLFPFLLKEGISEERQRLLLETCVAELKPLSQNPEALFRGSLNGEKIFEDLYRDRELPEVIREERLRDIYVLICPRIATLLCRVPAAVKDWEAEAWSESFRRLDDIGQQLRSLFVQVDELVDQPSRKADGTLSTVRQALAQKVALELDLTGLRGDRPIAAKFADLFVHPEISHIHEKKGQPRPVSVGHPDEAFEVFAHRDGRAVVIGPPGAGKSTWSKWLQSEALSPHWGGIAVRAELRQLTGGDLPSIQYLVRSAAGKHFAEELTVEILSRWFEEGLVVFLLDGFDEIRPSERDRVVEWIADLGTAARSCPFVLTSRPLTTDHLARLSGSWKTWNMEAFDEPRVVDYIGRWYRFAPLLTDAKREVDCGSLAQGWLADPTLGPLTGNPLLLSTLLVVHHLDGSLPGGRSQLYRRYVDGMLGIWDDRRNVAASQLSLTLEQKRRVLRAMAVFFFLSGREQIDEPEVVEWLEKCLASEKIDSSSEELLAVFRERSGLIVGPGVYSFAHKSIAEYLVAEAILQGDQSDERGRLDRFRLFEFRANDRWNTVTFLWAGLATVADLEALIEECRKAKELRLACGLLADQSDRLPADIRRHLTLRVLGAFSINIADDSRESTPGDSVAEIWEPGVEGLPKVDVRAPSIRGLKPHASLFDLIAKARDSGVLVLADIRTLPQVSQEVMWRSFSMYTPLDRWKAGLRDLLEIDKINERARAFTVAQNIFICRAFESDPFEFRAAVQAFCDELPNHAPLAAVALISVVIRFSSILDWDGAIQAVGEVFDCLDELPDPDSALLVSTREWWRVSPKPVDLLGHFLEIFSIEGRVRPEARERAIAYVNRLIGLRDGVSGLQSVEDLGALPVGEAHRQS